MTGRIALQRMYFRARHGVLEKEFIEGGDFYVDFAADYDITEAAKSDDIEKAADYSKVYTLIAERMSQPSKLIETVCYDLVNLVSRSFPELSNIEITLTKMNPPLDGQVESSSITVRQ